MHAAHASGPHFFSVGESRSSLFAIGSLCTLFFIVSLWHFQGLVIERYAPASTPIISNFSTVGDAWAATATGEAGVMSVPQSGHRVATPRLPIVASTQHNVAPAPPHLVYRRASTAAAASTRRTRKQRIRSLLIRMFALQMHSERNR